MKEAFDLIRKRVRVLSEQEFCKRRKQEECDKYVDCETCLIDSVIQIVSEVEAEYMKNPVYQYAMVYAKNLVDFGVDVRERLDSAVAQSMALNQAYIRGVEDERKRMYEADWKESPTTD